MLDENPNVDWESQLSTIAANESGGKETAMHADCLGQLKGFVQAHLKKRKAPAPPAATPNPKSIKTNINSNAATASRAPVPQNQQQQRVQQRNSPEK